MNPTFINDNFLLNSPVAVRLYHSFARDLPIIDYHNHLDAKDIYLDLNYPSIGDAWLGHDHYYWRAMRSNGVDEHFITGDATDFEKFEKWCETMPYLVGNPLYHWCHLELKKYFDIDLLINPVNCQQIWDACQQKISTAGFSQRQLLLKSNVKVLCTTDDPLSDLEYHQKLAKSDFAIQVLPTFRADGLFDVTSAHQFNTLRARLESVTDCSVETFDSYLKAIQSRIEFFHQQGCRLSDLGLKVVPYADATSAECEAVFARLVAGKTLTQLEIEQIQTAIFVFTGKLYHSYKWTMQLHIGVRTNVNRRRLENLGGGTGFSIIDDGGIARDLSMLLSDLDSNRQLPQTILYSLNPKDNAVLGSLIGAFQDSDASAGKIQMGSAWWFNDHKEGMEQQMKALGNLGALGRFVGMLTDSRSVLSCSRHEYFRRILCNLLAEWVNAGELPNDDELLKTTIENICFNNANRYFQFDDALCSAQGSIKVID